MYNVVTNRTVNNLPSVFASFNHTILVLIASIIGLVAVFTVASNVIVLIALVRSRREDNRNVISGSPNNGITKLTMASMAVVDVLIGTLLTPLFSLDVINKGRWYLGRDLCTARQSLNNLLCSVLIFNILFLALDKYLAICKPMHYRLLTTRHGYAMVVLSWSIPGVIFTVLDGSGLNHVGVEEALVTFDQMQLCTQALNIPVVFTMSIVVIVLPYSISAVLYFLVLREIRNFNKRTPRNKSINAFENLTDLVVEVKTASSISGPFVLSNDYVTSDTTLVMTGDIHLPVTDGKMTNEEIEGPCHPNIQVAKLVAHDNNTMVGRCPNKNVRSRPSHRNLRAYKAIGCIFFCFTVCWVPSWIFVIIFVYDGFTTTLWALIVFLFLTYTNATINPFIYCSIRSVRREVKTLLCRAP